MTPVSTALGELGSRLRALRERTGMTGAEFAAALGGNWRQPKISKIENGRQLPTEAEVLAWAAATGSDAEPLTALRRQAASDQGTSKERAGRAGSAVADQRNLVGFAESCAFLATFSPAIVPGDLQTAAYMREKAAANPSLAADGAPPEELGRTIAEKLRQQALLYEPGREFVHVLTEAALRLRLGAMSAVTLRGQLGHLAELATLPGHTFGVLPFSRPCPVETLSGFHLYDRDLVVVETSAGVLQLGDPEVVSRYSGWLDQLVDVALTGSEAAEFCHRVAASLPD